MSSDFALHILFVIASEMMLNRYLSLVPYNASDYADLKDDIPMIPEMTTAERLGLLPEISLLVFDTDFQSLFFFQARTWTQVIMQDGIWVNLSIEVEGV